MTKPNILVLGATGKVGGAVVNQLIKNKDVNVVAATRSPKKVQAFKDRGIDSVILDLFVGSKIEKRTFCSFGYRTITITTSQSNSLGNS